MIVLQFVKTFSMKNDSNVNNPQGSLFKVMPSCSQQESDAGRTVKSNW